MAIIASDSGGGRDFEPVSAGPHPAVCDMMVDLGIQDGGQYAAKHKVYLRFQIADERVQYEKDGEQFDLPAVIGVTQTVSLSEKSNLRPFLESWRGRQFTAEEIRAFDITAVAGKSCLLNIVHAEGQGGKIYANISSIMPLPKSMNAPKIEGEVIVYDDENKSNFDKLRPWLQEKINGQLEQREPEQKGKQPVPAGVLDDPVPAFGDDGSDIPF